MHTLVLMSGGFHPFHPGHFALYNAAKKAFPGADVVVGATNVTKDRPFDFKDKATLAQIAGVEPGHFVEVKRQFVVAGEPNIENRIKNPQDTILILVRSEKDAQDPKLQPWKLNPDGSVPMTKGTKNHPPKPTSNYLLPYVGNQKKLKPMTEHAYIAFLPVHEFGANDMTSATEIRNEWPTLDEKGKMNRAISLYPTTQKNPKLLKTVVNILNKNLSGELPTVTPNIKPIVQPKTKAVKKLKANPLKENLLKVIQTARPMLKEANIEQKLKLMKLLKESLSTMAYADLHPADELAHRLKKLSSQQLDYDSIDKMMKEISHKYGLDPTGKKLHVMFATKYGHNPDYWIKKIKNPVNETDVDEGKIINPKMINLYLQLRKPGAKPILVNKNNPIPYKAIDALINKISSKYNNVYPDMFSFIPADKESVAEGAYEDGVNDGEQGQRNPRASSIYGPSSDQYEKGYQQGVVLGKQAGKENARRYDEWLKPFSHLSNEKLQDLAEKFRNSPEDKMANGQPYPYNSKFQAIHQVLGQRRHNPNYGLDSNEGVTEGGWSQGPEFFRKSAEYRDSPGAKKFMYSGLTIEFTPDQLKIYKGGDLVFTKSGDFVSPTTQQVNTAKATASRLVAKIKKQDVAENNNTDYLPEK